MLNLRTRLARYREVGGIGARLRQVDVGYTRIVTARPPSLQDDARVDPEEQHESEQDQKTDNADAAAAPGPRRRSESATRRETGSRSLLRLRHADPRHSRFLFRRATASLRSPRRLHPGQAGCIARPLCMGRASRTRSQRAASGNVGIKGEGSTMRGEAKPRKSLLSKARSTRKRQKTAIGARHSLRARLYLVWVVVRSV